MGPGTHDEKGDVMDISVKVSGGVLLPIFSNANTVLPGDYVGRMSSVQPLAS